MDGTAVIDEALELNYLRDEIQIDRHSVRSDDWLDLERYAGLFASRTKVMKSSAMRDLMAITERPDLFAAVLIDSGVPDMLRAETADLIDVPEVGNSKTEEGFKALYAMSPYYYVKSGTPYPAALFTAGMNDPRLRPWQSTKMVARLQAATSSGKPVLLYVDFEGGHDAGNTAEEYQERLANSWSFLLWQFGESKFRPQ